MEEAPLPASVSDRMREARQLADLRISHMGEVEQQRTDDGVIPTQEEELGWNIPEGEVEFILEKRLVDGVTEYLVMWKGWEDGKWVPEGSLKGSERMVKKFEKSLLPNTELTAKKRKRESGENMEEENCNEKNSEGEKKKSLTEFRQLVQQSMDDRILANHEDDDWDIEEEKVEFILEKRLVDGVTEYLVMWKGQNDGKWMTEESLKGSEKIISKFEKLLDANSELSGTKRKREGSDNLEGESMNESNFEEEKIHSSLKKKKVSFSPEDILIFEKKKEEEDIESEEEEYEVEEILERRTGDEGREYRVKWKGWDDPTWEPEENLDSS